MQITLEHWHSTPIFSVKTDTEIGWASVFGHTKTKEGWAYPAYYPFGMWVLRDLNALGLNINFDSNALSQVQLLRQHHSQLCAAEQAYEQKQYPDLPLPSGFQWHLTPFRHQALGIAQLFYRHRHFLLWEMGTGKTKVAVESLRLLKKLGQVKRAVVLCPPVVISTWESEILRHSNGELTSLPWIPSNQHTRADLKKLSETVDVVIMSYARARMEVLDYATKSWTINNVDQMNEYRKIAGKSQFTAKELDDYKTYAATNFLDIPFDIIIADEVHSIGNFESDQTKSVLKISSKIPRRIELTGTAGDRPEKMYPLLQYLSPALLNMSFTQFKEKHLEISDQKKFLVTGYRNLHSLNQIVDSVVSRMKKADCLDLPPRTIQDIVIEPSVKQIARYNEVLLQMAASNELQLQYAANPTDYAQESTVEKPVLVIPNGAVRMLKLLQISSGFLNLGVEKTLCNGCGYQELCVQKNILPYTKKCSVIQKPPEGVHRVLRDFGNPKLETLEYYIEKILEEDQTNKILIWGFFHEELDDIEKLCQKLSIRYVRVDGTNSSKAKKFQDTFQTDPDCRIYLGQVGSAVGITLTAANYMIYYSLPLDSIEYDQSMDRNHRPGQTRPTTVYRFMVRGTLDEFLGYLLTHKYLVSITLTARVRCVTCTQQTNCASKNIVPFKSGCIYQSKIKRPIARPTLVELKKHKME